MLSSGELAPHRGHSTSLSLQGSGHIPVPAGHSPSLSLSHRAPQDMGEVQAQPHSAPRDEEKEEEGLSSGHTRAWLPCPALKQGKERWAQGEMGTGFPSCPAPPALAVLPHCQGRAWCSGDSREGNDSPSAEHPALLANKCTENKLKNPTEMSEPLPFPWSSPSPLSVTIYSFCTQFRDPSPTPFFLGFIGHCSFSSQDVRQD